MDINDWLVVWNKNFSFHIWDVIPTPLTNSIIFEDGYCTTNQIRTLALFFLLSFLFGTWSIAALCLALPMFCCFFCGLLGAFNSFIEFTKPGIEQLSNECDAHNNCPRSMNLPIGKTKLLKKCGLSGWPKERYPASRKPLKASLLSPKPWLPWLCMVLPLQSQFVEVKLCQAPIFGCIWCLDSQFASRPKARAPCWMSWLVGGGRSWMLNCGEKKTSKLWEFNLISTVLSYIELLPFFVAKSPFCWPESHFSMVNSPLSCMGELSRWCKCDPSTFWSWKFHKTPSLLMVEHPKKQQGFRSCETPNFLTLQLSSIFGWWSHVQSQNLISWWSIASGCHQTWQWNIHSL